MSSSVQHSEDTPMDSPKGKGKAVDEPAVEDSGSDDSDEEGENPVEDNLDEIDTSNVVGQRTRGKNIDFAKAARELPEEDDDDEDDDDFEEDDEHDEDKMEE